MTTTELIAFPPIEEFRAWLEGMPPDAVITKEWSCHTCPLARWLTDAGYGIAPYVSPNISDSFGVWRPDLFAAFAPLPKWANAFATLVDSMALIKAPSIGRFGPVTAADCRRVLRKVSVSKANRPKDQK